MTLHIDEMNKHNLLCPPPAIVASNLNGNDINEYMYFLNDEFDILWYSEKLQQLPAGNCMVQFLIETISLDERKILSLKLSDCSMITNIENNYEKLLNHEKLSCLEKLDMNNCKITFRSPLPFLGHLIYLNLSGNDIGRNIDIFQNTLPILEHLNLRDTNLMYIPRIINMTHLVTLDIANNQITSLEDLDSQSLHCLTTNNNLFETLDFNPAKVPALAKVYFGSEKCKFISFPIIQKTISDGLELMVSDVGERYLIIPPVPMLAAETSKLQDYIENTELTLQQFETTEIDCQFECVLWLIENENVQYQILNLSHEAAFCLHLNNSGLQDLVSKFIAIKTLNVSYCNLRHVPKLHTLAQLKTLILTGNLIKNFNDIVSESVRDLDLEGNPVLGYHLDEASLPRLEHLRVGSEHTKYVSLSTLRKIAKDKFEFHVAERYLEFLVFPPAHHFIDCDLRNKFVEQAMLDMKEILETSKNDDRIEVFQWVLKHDAMLLKSLKMNGQSSGVNSKVESTSVMADLMGTVICQIHCFENLQNLHMINNNLTNFPNLSSLRYLEVANFNQNQISAINFAHLPTSSLKELHLSQNPIEEFNIEFCQLNVLRELYIGSSETKYLAFPLLDKFAEILQIHVSCKESFVYPPYIAVCCHDELQQFLNKKVLNLKTIANLEKKLEAFQWILNRSGFQFHTLHLSGENLLLEKVMISFSCQALQNAREIHLADCGLEQIPNMSSLKKLSVLDIRNNYLSEINCDALPPSLKEIHLSGNPIVFVTVDLTRLRKLKLIDCGSKNTHYISFIILEKVYSWNTSMKLVLHVSEEHRQNLSLPPGELLSDKDGILDYIQNPEKYLASISKNKTRVQALQWLFKESGYQFKTLDFHLQTWLFCKGIDLSCVSLKNTITLVLSSCKLEALPTFDSAQNLKKLDLQLNNFTSLPTDQAFSSLETLNVIGNPLQELDFDNRTFPELKLVMFGSDQTWIVSRRVLSRYAEGGLDLLVPDDYTKRLLFPLWTTIERGSDSVRRFLRTPKLDLSGQKELCEKIRMDGISSLFNHPSVKIVSYIDISDCDLSEIPEWIDLNSLTKVDISGNKIDRIPKSDSLTEINLTKTNINMLALEKDKFPCLRYVTVGSEHLQFILFDTLTRLSVNLSRIPCRALIMPPNFVLSGTDRLQQYRTQPEIFLRYVDDDKLSRAIDWLLNESDFHFTCLDLSTQRRTFGSLGPESFKKLFHSTKLKHVTSLNLNECGLDEIPSIESLEKLETLEIVKNQVMCLSKLKNNHLRLINLTENPIETIDVDFEYSPEVAQINAGSEEIKCLSVRVLKRISERKLVIKLAEKYKHLIVLPPPHIVHKGLQPEEVGEYLSKGLFDISWYFARESDGGPGRLIADVKDILSLEKRPVVSFTADHVSDLQDLMDEPILSDVERLNLSDSNVTTLSKFSHFGKLIHLDVSRNPMENEEYQIELPHLSLLNLAECGINDIPNLSRMPQLKELILIRNRISSLITLESKSLESLHVDGNPLSVLDFDVNEVPALTFVTFGSETCQFVNLAILEKIARSEIKVELCPHHTSDLLVPPPDIFKDVQKLSKYVQCPQIDMSMFNTKNPEKQLECIEWLEEHRSIHVDTSILDLAGESLFCNFIDSPGLESLLSTFQHLTEVVLSNCDLSTTPNSLKLIQLEKLDLKNNSITKFPDNLPKSLIEIDLQGNPIVGIHFEETRLPNLKILKLGSMYTKYISEDIIRITTDGTLGLILEPGNTQHLIFPPGNRVKDRQSLKQYMDNVSLDLTSMSHFEWEETLSWVQNYCPSILKILKAYSMSKIDKKLHDLILYKTTLTKFTNLKQLSINGLGLQYLPDLSGLMSLTVLDCSKNKMESVDLTKLPMNSLRNFDITVNPILEFNNDLNSLKKLLKLHIGSPETRYICHPLLERSLSHLELSVHETCQKSLLYPSYRTVTDKEKLKQFVKRRELNLKSIPGLLKQDTLGWLLEKCAVSFETLSLAKQKHFLGEENSSLSQIIEGHSRGSLEEITEINLSDCGLTEIPDISSLKKLTLVDLSNNEIQQINDNFLPMSVENMVLKDNPIPCLAIDCHRFKELQHVQCGSRHTHYVSFQLLEQISEGRIEVTVPREYQECFLMPPYSLFERHSAEDNVALRNYIEHPENSLIHITDIEKRLTVLNWLLSSAKKDLKSDLSSHTWLSEKSIVLNTISLQNVHTLILSKCDFYEFPTFSDMSALIHLDLSRNNLNKISFEKLPQLQILNVVYNPMNEIDFETEDAPKLEKLSFGSPETRFISPRVLRLVKERNVTLHIPDEHREHLLFPPTINLNNVEAYVSCNKLGPAVITDPQERLSVIYWQLNQNGTNFETLNASNLKNIDLPKIFNHPAFVSVTQIDLSHCDLDQIPDWGMLRIKTANISFNRLSDVPPNPFLETLDVSETIITTLNLRRSNFPVLKCVTAGSHHLEYISFEVLKTFSVKIIDAYKESIIMPPSSVLDDPEELGHYIKSPCKYIDKVDSRKVSNAAMWLANDADDQFKEVNFAGLVALFKTSNIDLMWQGRNLSNITYLNIDNCELQVLPELQHLEHLVTLSLVQNSLDNISTLKNSHLQEIYMTENPIEIISFSFSDLPALRKITVGSRSTRVISLNVLTRILTHGLTVIVDSRYRECIMLPPPHVIVSGFEEKTIKQYVNNGVFDVQWFVSRIEKKSAAVADELTQILSAEERTFDSFIMCGLPELAQAVGDRIESLLEHETLQNISNLNLCDCQIAHTPPLKQLNKLTHVDLSGNHIGNDLDKIGDTSSKYHAQPISVLKLSNTKLKRIPDIMNLPNLKVLDVSNNQIRSLLNLESESLRNLNVTENECPVVNLNPEKVPKLSKVTFGSTNSNFVTFSVMKRVANSQVRLRVAEKHKTSLIIPPPSMLENTDSLKKYLKCKEISLQYLNTVDPEVQTKGIEWLIDNEDIIFETFNLKGERLFCYYIKNLENIFSKMNTITKLILSYCSLTIVPDLRDLVVLRTLDLTYNDIKTLEFIENASVIDVRFHGNPIVGIDFDNASLPNMKRLSIGSPCTKYISIELLTCAANGDLTLEITEEFESYLVYPMADSIKNRTQIRNFVRNISLYLELLPVDERKGVFDWVLEHNSSALKSLSLCFSSDSKLNDPILKTFEVENYRLVNLRNLNMSSLDIAFVPDLSSLKHLEELNLSFNRITYVRSLHFPESIQILHIEGNPINDVSISSINLSNLIELYCGSSSNYSIAFPIVEKFVDRTLKLHVAHDYLKNLLLPPAELIGSTEKTAEGRNSLQKYLKSPEKYLQTLLSRETKWKAFSWLISTSGKEFECLDLRGMSWIIDCHDQNLTHLFDKMNFLNCLKEVSLSNCNISNLNQLHFLPGIEHLDISENKLENLSGLIVRKLKKIDVSDNPIKIIDFDPECFPLLTYISFGSDQSTSVSLRVLNLSCNKGLQMHVNEEFRKYLLLPQWEVLTKGKESVEEWIKDNQFSLSHLESDEDKLQALELTTSQREKFYASINLNNEASLFKSLSSDRMLTLFGSPVFEKVTEAYFRSCDLDAITFVNILKHLELLDVADNRIDDIPESKSLKTIILSENNTLVDDNQALSFDLRRCPHLKHVTAGSTNMKFISFSIRKSLTIDIIPPYHEKILPPKEQLAADTELERYTREPERFLTLPKYPDGFWWLMENSDKVFKEINLSKQITSPDTSESIIYRLFSSHKFRSVQVLSLENCSLSHLPDLVSLECLEKINLNNNSIQELSYLKNSSLKYISILNNPIIQISYIVGNCKSLTEICCGSTETKFIDINALGLFAQGSLNINVADNYIDNILIPPSRIILSKQDVDLYIRSETFNVTLYSNIFNSNRDSTNVLMDVLEFEQRKLKSFTMSEEPQMYAQVGADGLEELLKHRKLCNIEEILINNCKLLDIPPITYLGKLKQLNISGNPDIHFSQESVISKVHSNLQELYVRDCDIQKLPTLPDNLEILDISCNNLDSIEVKTSHARLKHLDISHNPISDLEITPNSFPALERIRFGSKELLYIGFNLLHHLSDDSCLIRTQPCPNLVFPPRNVFNEDALKDFLRHPYNYIKYVKQGYQRGKVLIWLLENYKGYFTRFTFNYFENSTIQFSSREYSSLINKYQCLLSVEILDLSNCKLDECPDLSRLTNLLELNLENNSITRTNEIERCTNLRKLSISKNPLEAVSLNINSLQIMRLGSEKTKFVGHKLLQAKSEGKLDIEVPKPYQQILKYPSYNTINDNSKLKLFLRNPGEDLLNIQDFIDRKLALVWTVTTNQYNFSKLDLSNQQGIFNDMSLEDLRIFLNSTCLQDLTYFSMCNCAVAELPIFDTHKLKILDMSKNNLRSIELKCQFGFLKELYLTENPLERIEFDISMFPKLEKLGFGSQHTKYISIPILEKVAQGLEPIIPESCQKFLILPSYKTITGHQSRLLKFMKNPEKYIPSQISDLNDRKNIIMWLFNSRTNQTSFELDNQRDSNVLLKRLLDEPSLVKIEILSLKEGDLTFLPDLKQLENLKTLDISKNHISNLNYDYIPYSIERINIEGNPIKSISVEQKVLRAWESTCIKKTIRCGSKLIRFISFDVAKLHYEEFIHIDITPVYQHLLLMPTYTTLSSAHLGDYLSNPDNYLNEIHDSQQMKDVLEFLFNTEKCKFKTSFRISNPVCADLDLCSFFNNESFEMVHNISINNCGLSTLQGLTHLPNISSHLNTLDVSGNNINNMGSMLCQLPLLEVLKIDNNPIEVIDFDFQYVPSLKYLIFGSKVTKYVKYSLLEIMVRKNVKLEIVQDASNLIFPGEYYVKQGHEELKMLCEHPEIGLEKMRHTDQKVMFLNWLCEELDKEEFKSFRLSKQPELNKNALRILSNWKLRSVNRLELIGCNFTEFPDLENFPKLQVLNLSNNTIKEIPNHMASHEYLKELDLTGNPIETIDSSFKYFPSLSKLKVGSKQTSFLGLSLLKQHIDRRLSLHVLEYEEYLILPSAALLKIENLVNLKRYVENPNIRNLVNGISKLENKVKAVEWLSIHHSFEKFEISAQAQLCETLEEKGLQNILNKLVFVTEICLRSCELMYTPNVAALPQLISLDLSYNNISQMSNTFSHDMLLMLNLEGNPLTNISLDRFPKVTHLICGSKHGKSISDSTLKRIVDGTLYLQVLKLFRGYLQLPKYRIIEGGPMAIAAYLNEEEFDMSNVRTKEDIELYCKTLKESDKQYKALRMSKSSWKKEILETVFFQDIIGTLQSIESLYLPACDIDVMPTFFRFSKLSHIELSNSDIKPRVIVSLPKTVISLVARNCNLTELPLCLHIETLDITDNKLTNLSSSKVFEKLKNLFIQDNKLKTIDYNRRFFPFLEKLGCGSDECNFISFNVINEIISGKIRLSMSPEVLTKLKLPLKSDLNPKSLEFYRNSPEVHVQDLYSLVWLLDESKFQFSKFNLCGKIELCHELGHDQLQNVLRKNSLKNVTELCLRNLELTRTPLLHHLKSLQLADLSQNRITDFDSTFAHNSLANLNVEENPILFLKFDIHNFPQLSYLKVGSQETKYIARPILSKVLDGTLKLHISPNFKEFLEEPTHFVLNDKQELKRFLNVQKRDLSTKNIGHIELPDIKKKLQKFSADITTIILNGQTCISVGGQSTLENIFSELNLTSLTHLYLNSCAVDRFPNIKTLNNLVLLDLGGNRFHDKKVTPNFIHKRLQTLVLSNCNLRHMFDLKYFPTLKNINLGQNELNSIEEMNQLDCTFETLEKIYLDENPLDEIKIDAEKFPCLNYIQIGSPCTKYISFALLKRAADDKLHIKVKEVYQKYLLLCPSKVLDGKTKAIKEYLETKEVNLSYISNDMQRYMALLWLLNEKEEMINVLNFSGQSNFFMDERIDVKNLFRNPKLRHVEVIYLDSCNLQNIPLCNDSLPKLKTLYLVNNKITRVQNPFFKGHPQLEKLVIDGNPINIIHIHNLRKFPKLKIIQAGSEHTHHLSPAILDAVTKKKDPLKVVIVEEFGKFMRTPPIDILNGGPENIEIFLKAKCTKTHDFKLDMLKNTTRNVLMLLGEPMAGKTSLLSTLRQDEAIFTSEYERTVLLDRSNLVLKKDTIISTYDFGAQDIYEIEYPMFLRSQNVIALIVIDLNEYDTSHHDELVTRWLVNCVLCADCKVIFVPSKSEMLDPDQVTSKCQKLREQIVKYITHEIQLLNAIHVKEKLENAPPRKCEDYLRKIERSLKFFSSLIEDISIVTTSAYLKDGLDELKKEILSKIEKTENIENGEIYLRTINYILEKGREQQYYLSLAEVERYLSDQVKINKRAEAKVWDFDKSLAVSEKTLTINDKVKACLDYYRRRGWILWYNECEQYIYTNVDNILALHRELYRHDLEAVLEYNVYEFYEIIEDKVLFDVYKDLLLKNGLMYTEILKCLWKKFRLSEDEFHSMIQLLIVNDHCFVDAYSSKDTPVYRFPWFVREEESSDYFTTIWPKQLPQENIEFNLKYMFLRNIPAALYERISVRLHNVLKDKDRYQRKDWKDGVYIARGKLKLLIQKFSFTHSHLQTRQLSIKFRAPGHEIINLWEWCCLVYNDVLKALIEVDTIVTYDKKFVCPHCILNGRSYEESEKYPLGVIMESVYDGKTTTELCRTEVIPAAYLKPPRPGQWIYFSQLRQFLLQT